ncbi:class E sortase [Carbonactinospora thermoautotrophica]|uniref:class E sortase n=1 Tax=Carbonactinospora thermoautotrophica TaxID=1469144 RepID=UPI002271878E|nr:class E sortase [Carbonactinospora thermoautotrophica]
MRAVIRGFGELLITLGVIILLFCGYQVFWTSLQAKSAMNHENSQLREQWEGGAGGLKAFSPGQGFAIIHIPRLGAGYEKPILEGTSLDILDKGVGHYEETAMPGEVGNFSLAGHRLTHGEPFRHLDKLRKGDYVVIETADFWYTYRITTNPYIVLPSDTEVIAPVPNRPGKKPTKAMITLTTCHPWYSSEKRMILHGVLVSKLKRSDGPPPALQS